MLVVQPVVLAVPLVEAAWSILIASAALAEVCWIAAQCVALIEHGSMKSAALVTAPPSV